MTIQVSLSVAVLCGLFIGAFLFGFLLQRRQIAKQKMRVAKLSREMVENHAEILELQKEFVALEKGQNSSRTPVRPLTAKPTAEVRNAVR